MKSQNQDFDKGSLWWALFHWSKPLATEYDDTRDWALFVRDSKTLTNGNGYANRWSEQVLAALRAAGVLDNMVDGTVPPAADKLWLDKNTDPAVLRQWDATGLSWVPMTYNRLFGQAALGVLAVTGGTGNAVVVAQPNSGFQANRLYTMSPTANNTAGAVTIQVAGVGTYPVKYGDVSNLLAAEFTSGRQTTLLFNGSVFTVLFSVGDLNASVTAAAASASAASTSAGNAATSASNAASAAAGVITGATSDDTIDDTDEVIYKTGTTIKRATFAAGLIASIFQAARTIANATFAGATFRLRNAATAFYFNLDVSGITASRTLTPPDKSGTIATLSDVVFTKEYVSAQQTITVGGTLTIAHGLGVQPKEWVGYLICTTVDLGFSVNDRYVVPIGPAQEWNNAQANLGVDLIPDATSLNLRYGSTAGVFYIRHKSTGTLTAITPASWRFVVGVRA